MMRRSTDKRVRAAALELLKRETFLFDAAQMIQTLGIEGERRNCLIVFLSCLTARFSKPISVIVKGSSAAGKSTLVNTVLKLFPDDAIVDRASLSEKALSNGSQPLSNKILWISEHAGGKKAHYELRLLQSEGAITHEYTTVSGRSRSTSVAKRVGSPVVISTTTEERIFTDDETRFLSLFMDESSKQTEAIIRAHLKRKIPVAAQELKIWKEASRLLIEKEVEINLPDWFELVFRDLPLGISRVRRDVPRIIALCKAVALCRCLSQKSKVYEVSFPDYCVAYTLLNQPLSRVLSGIPSHLHQLSREVEYLNTKKGRLATSSHVADRLGWSKATTHRRIKKAVAGGWLTYDGIGRIHNEKAVQTGDRLKSALTPPATILALRPDLGPHVVYISPFSGEAKKISASKSTRKKKARKQQWKESCDSPQEIQKRDC